MLSELHCMGHYPPCPVWGIGSYNSTAVQAISIITYSVTLYVTIQGVKKGITYCESHACTYTLYKYTLASCVSEWPDDAVAMVLVR